MGDYEFLKILEKATDSILKNIDLIQLYPDFIIPSRDDPKRQISMNGQLDFDQILANIIYNTMEQKIIFSAYTWQLIINFFRTECLDEDARQQKEYGAEILLTMTTLSADELFKGEEGGRYYPTTDEDLVIRNEYINSVFLSIINSLTWSEFKIREDSEFDQRVKLFLCQKSILHAMATAIEICLPPRYTDRLGENEIKEMLKSDYFNIYSYDQIGDLYGITLRSGIVVCTQQLPRFEGFLANAYCVALQQTAHWIIRYHYGDYNFGCPNTGLPSETQDRILEAGKMTEIAIFGGFQNGHQIELGAIGAEATREFIRRAESVETLPLFTKEEIKTFGLHRRFNPSLPFAGDLKYNIVYIG